MNLLYKVIQPGEGNIGHVIGYARYNTCADLWGEEVYRDTEMTELCGAYTCNEQDHSREEITLRRYHTAEPDMTMRYCTSCECLVTPPFDGYTYHDYDCEMDDSCVCDHPAEGPEPLTMADVELASQAIVENSQMSDYEHGLFVEQHAWVLEQYRKTVNIDPAHSATNMPVTVRVKYHRFGLLRWLLYRETIGLRAL